MSAPGSHTAHVSGHPLPGQELRMLPAPASPPTSPAPAPPPPLSPPAAAAGLLHARREGGGGGMDKEKMKRRRGGKRGKAEGEAERRRGGWTVRSMASGRLAAGQQQGLTTPSPPSILIAPFLRSCAPPNVLTPPLHRASRAESPRDAAQPPIDAFPAAGI
eukprot:197419-Rhodomonas_salina.2